MDERTLPPTFSFSQSSLQAYVDCRRRFWLAYVEQLPWPAVDAAPVQQHEQMMRLGALFHRLIERTEMGMAPARVAANLEPPLATWYDAYVRHRPANLPTEFVEVERVLAIPFEANGQLSTVNRQLLIVNDAAPRPSPLAPFRLAAKYDLIAAERNGRAVIVDWKTAKRRTDPGSLRHRLQTAVYPYVLVEASRAFAWGPVRPEQVEMRYWFTAAPGQPVVFRYDAVQHEANGALLRRLLADILASRTETDFPKVADTPANRKHFCAYCVYRSRCNRGEAAGDLDALDDAADFFVASTDEAMEFSLEDVDELAF